MNRPYAQVAFAISFALLGILCGCSGSSDATATAQTAAEPATKPAASTPPAPANTSLDGATLFASNCSGCHGDKGAGGRAPVLAGAKTPQAETVKFVTNGKGRKMPAFKGRLSDDQITEVAKYVATL